VESATHYLLSELAFLEFAPEFFDSKRVCYLYHRNWQVYEDYIHGRYDGVPKPNLDFLLLEAPYETYQKVHSVEIDGGSFIHDTYSRVMRSGVLRAAYVDYPPVIARSGDQFSGVFYELIAKFAEQHALKIDWVEEIGYGVVTEGLAEARFDIFCSATWPTPERHKYALLSRPVYFSDVGVWVRQDSALAKCDWIMLNDERHRIAVTDGDITHEISLTDFTFAKWVRAPQLGKVKALLDFVAEDRADATMVERITYEAYADQLRAPLVNIAEDKPIRRYSNSFLIGKGQHDFLDILNAFLDQNLKNGNIAALLQKYDMGTAKGIYLPEI
jgi:ABC-type amino acid transport substrate-binding protein